MSYPYGRYPGEPSHGDWAPPPAPVPPPGPWPSPYGPAHPPYGPAHPPYGPPVPPPQRRNRVVLAWTVAGVLLTVAVLVVIGVGGFRMGSTEFSGAFAAPSTSPPADWAVIGDDAGLDPYAERCHDGELNACDELYALADPGSDYEYYALTCGGRVQPRDVQACIFLE